MEPVVIIRDQLGNDLISLINMSLEFQWASNDSQIY
jgi:hypothetical protein